MLSEHIIWHCTIQAASSQAWSHTRRELPATMRWVDTVAGLGIPVYGDRAAIASPSEAYGARHEGVQRVVPANAYAWPAVEPSSPLANYDAAWRDVAAAQHLNAKHLGMRVPTVPGCASGLLLCHRAGMRLGALQ